MSPYHPLLTKSTRSCSSIASSSSYLILTKSNIYSAISIQVLFDMFTLFCHICFRTNININDVLGSYSLTLVDTLDTLAVSIELYDFEMRLLRINLIFVRTYM